MIRAIVQSLRVRQWVKNVVVFAPLVFSGKLFEPVSAQSAWIGFVAFCFISSGAYLVNDLVDRRVDRFHPLKKKRPVASGALPVPLAAGVAAALVWAATALGFGIHRHLGLTLLAYALLNMAYSTTFKRVVILDVVALALGFVLRIWGGAVVLNIIPSHWLQLSMFFLALFLGLTKRRQELVILHRRALRHRGVLSDYSPAFIDQLTSILTSVALLCYALYTVSPEVVARVGRFGFINTVPFVVYGIFRYLYVVHIRKQALDPTEALLSDRPMMISALAWLACVLVILY